MDRLSAHRQSDREAVGLYRSGDAVPAGTYVSLDEGRLVRVYPGGVLPQASPFPLCYIRLSDSPDYRAPLSLIAEAA